MRPAGLTMSLSAHRRAYPPPRDRLLHTATADSLADPPDHRDQRILGKQAGRATARLRRWERKITCVGEPGAAGQRRHQAPLAQHGRCPGHPVNRAAGIRWHTNQNDIARLIPTTLPSRPGAPSGARAHYEDSRLCRIVHGPTRPAPAWRPGQQDQYHIPAWHTSRCGWPQSGPGARPPCLRQMRTTSPEAPMYKYTAQTTVVGQSTASEGNRSATYSESVGDVAALRGGRWGIKSV